MIRAFFARYGKTSHLGKLTEPLGSIRLHEEILPLAIAAARKARKPLAEWVRDHVELGLLGRAELDRRTSIYLDQLEELQPKRTGPEDEAP